MPGGKLLMRLGKPFMDRQINKYKHVQGPEQSKFMGFPVLLLTTVGARSGRSTPMYWAGSPTARTPG